MKSGWGCEDPQLRMNLVWNCEGKINSCEFCYHTFNSKLQPQCMINTYRWKTHYRFGTTRGFRSAQRVLECIPHRKVGGCCIHLKKFTRSSSCSKGDFTQCEYQRVVIVRSHLRGYPPHPNFIHGPEAGPASSTVPPVPSSLGLQPCEQGHWSTTLWKTMHTAFPGGFPSS